ncbi:CFI-box-CTERM domain-containing protein [Cryobacterium sp. TMT2-42-4]|uniref:CFI-box-CTERM domain-containing protein n=1 Tax=Cryobacterium sp. TMT2-42-4 TaxID=1259255 RepID=UPI00106D877B|nr:CFI-box-CTERM domain-containing protein [Cryobacterium sp. TMT2-42-4]TFC34118.1 hypothetical protein E3O18_12565 [Cryobacterium sp. TMT2-42-4]
MSSNDKFAVLRSNVLASVERHDRLRFLAERGADLAELRALGPEFSVEDRGAIFFNAMLNEFFTVASDHHDYVEVLSKVNRFVDVDRATGSRAWSLVREHMLQIGRQRGWSTVDTIWEDWTPKQQREFTTMIDKDLKEKRSGCYVATAVYGTYDCRELWVLRRFRDETLSTSRLGRAFTAVYYAVSPIAVRHGGRPLRAVLRRPLDVIVRFLLASGVSDAPYRES